MDIVYNVDRCVVSFDEPGDATSLLPICVVLRFARWREEPLLGGENRRQVSVREGNTQRTIDCRCMQCTKRVMVSTRMTVTRDCTFFQRRQRSKCTGGEVRARRGGKLVSDRRFSQRAGAHQNSRPLRRTPFKAACSPTQVPSIQDTPHTFTMASRPVTRALRQTARQLVAAPAQKRTFVSALRAGATAAPKAAVTSHFQQKRGVKTIDFAGTKEEVYGKFESKTLTSAQVLTTKQSVPTGPRRSFLCVTLASMASKLISIAFRADNRARNTSRMTPWP
jgi:hypothetical protein